MGPKVKKQGPTGLGDLTSVVNQCLIVFFNQFTLNCGCSTSCATAQEEITSCKSLIMAQSALIHQLQSDIKTLKSEVLQMRANGGKGLNTLGYSGENRRLSITKNDTKEPASRS